MSLRFRFIRFQHSGAGRGSLDDLIALISGQLMALGHACEADDTIVVDDPDAPEKALNYFLLDPGTVNIVIEAFHNQAALEVLATVQALGGVIVAIATEQPTPDAGAFNHGFTPQARARYLAFPHAAPFLHAIWHLVPSAVTAGWYGGFGRPASYLNLGHAPGLAEFMAAASGEGGAPAAKLYDYGFFGSQTPRRVDMLADLLAAAPGTTARVIGVSDAGVAPWEVRNQAMRECRVGLQLRAYDEAELVSSARCAMFLHLGLPVIGDRHRLAEPWGRIVDLADDDAGFVAMANAARDRAAEIHARQWAAFTALLTPQACVGAAIAATLTGAHAPDWQPRELVKPVLPEEIVAAVSAESDRIAAERARAAVQEAAA